MTDSGKEGGVSESKHEQSRAQDEPGTGSQNRTTHGRGLEFGKDRSANCVAHVRPSVQHSQRSVDCKDGWREPRVPCGGAQMTEYQAEVVCNKLREAEALILSMQREEEQNHPLHDAIIHIWKAIDKLAEGTNE